MARRIQRAGVHDPVGYGDGPLGGEPEVAGGRLRARSRIVRRPEDRSGRNVKRRPVSSRHGVRVGLGHVNALPVATRPPLHTAQAATRPALGLPAERARVPVERPEDAGLLPGTHEIPAVTLRIASLRIATLRIASLRIASLRVAAPRRKQERSLGEIVVRTWG